MSPLSTVSLPWECPDPFESLRLAYRRFTGIEFVIAHAQPPDLFILHKRRRTSPTETTVVGAYHILNGNVYQAPSLFEVLNQRLVRRAS